MYKPSSVFNGVSVYSQQGSISNNCGTVKVGLSSAWQTSAGVKPKVGCTDWVRVDSMFSFKKCSLGVCVERLTFAGFFKEVEVWDTFVKMDGMCESCKNVRSWLINFRHLSSPWINSLSVWSLCTTGGICLCCCVMVGRWESKDSSVVFTWYSCSGS